ncbi:hypothetical protein ASPCAL06848 [Aspergillus calidoustus]|uniref:Cellobiose dehydrogenase-like cytochrome domain-containing protein n=1 Tax=Aspergillus calidoustus TaxID=454130 RepID=A0A0U4Z7K1_ASPCI|nr:hypothetical protein ASPCAL06848 [Aspergillus calidoustus]
MFIVYASSATEGIVSPRAGTGHVPPEYNPDGRVSLLPGSGIRNGTMTTRFQYQTCLQSPNASSSANNSSWIWAYKNGSPMWCLWGMWLFISGLRLVGQGNQNYMVGKMEVDFLSLAGNEEQKRKAEV